MNMTASMKLDSIKLTKIVSVASILATMMAMIIHPLVSLLMFVVIVIPLALWGRHKINGDELEVKDSLASMQAQIAFKAKCYEGYKSIVSEQEYVVFFKGKEIVIVDEDNKKHIIAKKEIKNVELLTLAQIKDIAVTNQYITLGKLGKVIHDNQDNKLRVRKSRNDKQFRYLLIRVMTSEGKIKCLSFFEMREQQYFNKLALGEVNLEAFCKQNY